MRPESLIEAALFSAGRALSPEEISAATGLDQERIRKHVLGLVKEYESKGSALHVARVGDKYLMKLRDDYLKVASKLAQTELPREILKTAALIAYHQPVKQSDLHMMIGNKVYEHVKLLVEKELVKSKPSGRSFELSTTKTFLEYFGIEATNREEIKRLLAKKAGIKEPLERKTDIKEPEKGAETDEPAKSQEPAQQ